MSKWSAYDAFTRDELGCQAFATSGTRTEQREAFLMTQRLLDFDTCPCNPSVSVADLPRLTGQNKRILERLRQGPATNVELCEIAMKYTSRISDLRKAGYTITNKGIGGGVTEYRLG